MSGELTMGDGGPRAAIVADEVVAVLLRRIFQLLVGALCSVVVFAYYVGLFFARTDGRLSSIEDKMKQVTDTVVAGIDARLRVVEVAAPAVADLKTQQISMENRLRLVEQVKR